MYLHTVRIRRRRWIPRYLSLSGYLVLIVVLTLLFLVGLKIGRADAAGVKLQWDPYTQTPQAPADGFRMYRCQGSGCNQAQPPTFAALNQTLIGVTLTTYTDSTVTQANTYCYVMSAVSVVAGDSAFSNSVCLLVPTTPEPPLNLRGTAIK